MAWYNEVMKKYVAVLGRQPRISVAELESLFGEVRLIAPELAEFQASEKPDVRRLGGTLKIAEEVKLPELWKSLPAEGKITLGVSDFSRGASAYLAQREALKLKRMLVKMGRSVRVVANKTAVLSSATSIHNHLFGATKIEILKNGGRYYRVISVQDIEGYVERDRKRPARDAKVGMLPPKLAQILINLCGDLPKRSRVLDPFCGTGVVLQEAALMGYVPYGTDLSERMVQYSERNLEWLTKTAEAHTRSRAASTTPAVAGSSRLSSAEPPDALEQLCASAVFAVGDAMSYQWTAPIDAVACEGYLGPPMSLAPAEIKLKQAKQECGAIVLGFLKNLAGQIRAGTPVVMAVPAWLRPDGSYERLNLLDEISNLRYNVCSFKNLGQKDLLYHRDGQVVAREIIVLRKK